MASAARTIHESAEWNRKARERDEQPTHPITEREVTRFEDSAHVFRQTREQPADLNIEGSVKVLRSCVHRVLLDVTQDIQRQAELAEPEFGPVIEEFEFRAGCGARLDAAAGGLA